MVTGSSVDVEISCGGAQLCSKQIVTSDVASSRYLSNGGDVAARHISCGSDDTAGADVAACDVAASCDAVCCRNVSGTVDVARGRYHSACVEVAACDVACDSGST